MADSFNYVIARFWPGKKSLCCYMVHNREVMFGNDAESKAALEYVQRQDPAKKNNPWRVVKIDFPL